ncbi:kynurenine formamidase [Gastrophryne carolinensis]
MAFLQGESGVQVTGRPAKGQQFCTSPASLESLLFVFQELEHQYSPSQWSHRMDKDTVIEAHVREITSGTRRARATVHTLLNVQYGERESELLDLYLPEVAPKGFPLLVYIHGGYWQFLSKEESGFMAPPLVSRGIAVMAMDYDIAPKGDMELIVSQVRRSIAFTVTRYPDITSVYLCGHSAGAHLAAMALTTDWSHFGVTPRIEGALLISGVYELLPITRTYVNDALRMSQDVARRNSPMLLTEELMKSAPACRLVIAVAEHDSPEFHRQSRDFHQRLQQAGMAVSFQQIDDTDHFNVIEMLPREEYQLTQVSILPQFP